MRVLIVYGTYKGCTKRCAEALRARIGAGDVVDVRETKGLDMARYDTVVIGSSIRIGKVHPGIRGFVARYRATLLTKRLGFFICSGEQKEAYFARSFPPDVLANATCRSFFGGELDVDDFGPLTRLLLRKKAGVTESYSRLLPEAIVELAAACKA